MSTTDFRVQRVTWADAADVLSAIRRRVFIDEQHVPEALEWDGLDDRAVHVLARHDDDAIGCGRLLDDGHIGRMAVLPDWRARGVGRALLDALLDTARERGDRALFLHAQTSAVGFYERAGFRVEGEEFMDAGIPHRTMRRTLST